MYTHFIAAQLVGIVAVAMSLSIFQVNNRRRMLNIGVVSAALWTLHFFLLGAATGAGMNAVGGLRDFTVARVRPTARNLWVLCIIMVLATIVTIITWNGWICLLPLIACGLNGLSFWSTNTSSIRRLYLLVPPLWFAYNFVVGSYPGMAIECLIVFSNLFGQYRFDVRPKLLLAGRKAAATSRA